MLLFASLCVVILVSECFRVSDLAHILRVENDTRLIFIARSQVNGHKHQALGTVKGGLKKCQGRECKCCKMINLSPFETVNNKKIRPASVTCKHFNIYLEGNFTVVGSRIFSLDLKGNFLKISLLKVTDNIVIIIFEVK